MESIVALHFNASNHLIYYAYLFASLELSDAHQITRGIIPIIVNINKNHHPLLFVSCSLLEDAANIGKKKIRETIFGPIVAMAAKSGWVNAIIPETRLLPQLTKTVNR